jgi:NADH-quinone oxidoreductase subunit G
LAVEPAAPPAVVTWTLDGREVTSPPGTILVDAAAAHGVEIPIFCYEPRLGPPIGACRMCLVQIEGMRGFQTACSTPVSGEMVVVTESPEVKGAQDGVLELLLANHPLDCPVCDKGGECPLQDRTFTFGPGRTRFIEPKRHFPKPLDLSQLVAIDRERCIACFRCIRFSQDVAGDGQLTFQERGAGTEVATFSGDPYVGRFTGNIIDLCPVGALTSTPYRFVSRPWDIANAPSVCALCPVGCNTELTLREDAIRRVTGRPEPNFAVEEGWICDKGRWGYPIGWSEDRFRHGLVRDGDEVREVSLEEAVDAAAVVLARAAAPGVLVGPSATVEEAFLARELAAILSGATVGRLGIPGHGLGALRALPGAQLGDLDEADLVVVVGGDPANQQPVVELRVRKAARRGAHVVVVGPRPQALAAIGTDVRTAPGRLAIGIAGLAEAVREGSAPFVLWDEADLAAEPDAAAELAGILTAAPAARQLELGAEVNGAGLRALGIPVEGILETIEAQRLGTLLVVHADPLEAPGASRWAAALPKAGPVIQIASHRSTLSEHAVVVLPALTAYEQEGVIVSMNGRAQRLRPGARGPDGAAGAWELLIALSHRLGKPLPHRTPANVFAAAAASAPALAGLDYATLGVEGAALPAPLSDAPDAALPPIEPAGDGLRLVTTTPIFGDAASWRSDALASVRTGAFCAVAPDEAQRLGLAAGARVRLSSPHGSCELGLVVDPELPPGAAFCTLGVPGSGVERLLAVERGPVNVRVEHA